MVNSYATIAIIYKIITGRNLFAMTALTFPEIVKRIKLIDPAGPDVDRDVASIYRLFWNSAMAENSRKAKGRRIAADQLLEAMFERVRNTMYLPHWTSPHPAIWRGKAHLPAGDIATYQATM